MQRKVSAGKTERGAAVFIHPSQFPEVVRAELLQSLRRREINHKFHYESHKQAQKWLALHEAHSPARRDTECLAMYDDAFAQMSQRINSRSIRVIGLGCGGGQKDVRLLELLDRRARQLAYLPCDVSLPLVLTARVAALRLFARQRALTRQTAAHGSADISPFVCDLAAVAVDDFSTLIPTKAGEQRIVTFFGMIPNFEPATILPRLAAMVRRGDWLLFGANLVPEANQSAMRQILPQYDNDLTRDWLMTFLLDLGVEAADGRLNFDIEKVGGAVPLHRFVARFRFIRRRVVRIGPEEIIFNRGESLRLFFSYRYTVGSMSLMLARHRLEVVQHWTVPSREEGVFLCHPRRIKKKQQGQGATHRVGITRL